MTANDVQHGGEHYKTQAIQVWDYITSNGIPYLEGNAIKYLSRWRAKGGLQDLLKAKHYVEKLIENEQKRLEEEAAKVPETQARCDVPGGPYTESYPGNRRKFNGQLECGCWTKSCQGHPDTNIGEAS